MRTLWTVLALSLACAPPAKVAEFPRDDVGTERTKIEASLSSALGDESTVAGLPAEAVVDEAYLLESGTHRVCVAVVARTATKWDMPLQAWTFELDGAPLGPETRPEALHDYAFVTEAAAKEKPAGVDQAHAVVCGPPTGAQKAELVISFRRESIEWSERFEWRLR